MLHNKQLNYIYGTIQESLIYFGAMCLFLALPNNKHVQLMWFLIALAITFVKNFIVFKKKSLN